MKIKKLAAMAVGCTLAAGTLVGCGSSSDSASGGEIRIGALLALSGEQAYANAPIKSALEMAADQINASGGLDGKTVKLYLEDSKGTPQDGVAAYNKLVSTDGVHAILGVSTPVIAAVLPLAERNHDLLLDISTVGPAIWKSTERKYSFSIYPKADIEMAGQASFARDKLDANSAAVLAVDTETGQASADAFVDSFQKDGGTVTGTVRYPADTSDFRPYLEKVASGHPGLVTLIHNVEGGTIVRQAKEMGLSLQFIGYSGSVNDQFLDLAKGAAEGMYATSAGWNPGDKAKAVQDFITDYKAKVNQDPTVYAAMGYDGLNILAKVMAEHGSTPDDIAAALRGLDYTGATGETKIGDDGLVTKEIYIKTVKNGQWTDVAN